MALDLDTAKAIIDAVCADVSARRTIGSSKRPSPMLLRAPMRVVVPATIESALEHFHVAGPLRNAWMLAKGMDNKDDEFVELSCQGIAIVTQGVIFTHMMSSKLPKVLASRVVRRKVNGFEHKGTGVSMKDGTDYVFDWWPTLNPKNPVISSYAQWFVGGSTVEFRDFKGLP